MIQITRSLAHEVRSVFRRLARKSDLNPVVSFETGSDGLRVRLHNTEVTAEVHEPGSFSRDSITIPLGALADFESKKKDVVTLERSDHTVQVSWQDGVVPQVREYEQPERRKTALPELPRETVSNEPGFLKALADAVESASHDTTRFAINNIQLRGKAGEIVATDGRQLLVQTGYDFGWQDDLLIPASTVFACRELSHQEVVTIGKTDKHVMMTAGAWTLYFPIDTAGRFPQVEQVIPSLTGNLTCAAIESADADFLIKALSSLPQSEDENAPVTLDLASQVLVRARPSDHGRVTELHLARSSITGKPARISINRELLARALELGLNEVCFVSSEKPVVFRDDKRKLVVMVLGKDTALGPADKALQISSANGERFPPPEREKQEAPVQEAETPISNGVSKKSRTVNRTSQRKPIAGTLATLVSEAEALKDELRHAYTRTHQLLTAIKKHRRQSRLVQSTLANLRQLKNVAS